MHYLIKSFGDFFKNTSGQYMKPATCPHCGYGTDASTIATHNYNFDEPGYLAFTSCRCTACSKVFAFGVFSKSETDPALPSVVFPSCAPVYENDILSEVSPRFISLMNQSLRAESNNDIDLAATGYRIALECLVKDYVIYEKLPNYEKVAGKSLEKAIGEYLGEIELVKAGDVVRILGNDYAHYSRKHPELDFILLKRYMEIFIKLIETKLLIAHPPVERSSLQDTGRASQEESRQGQNTDTEA